MIGKGTKDNCRIEIAALDIEFGPRFYRASEYTDIPGSSYGGRLYEDFYLNRLAKRLAIGLAGALFFGKEKEILEVPIITKLIEFENRHNGELICLIWE